MLFQSRRSCLTLISLNKRLKSRLSALRTYIFCHILHIQFNTPNDRKIVETSRPPKPKTCFTWGGVHYKTFDDRIYSFDSDCPHVLLREARDDIFTILTLNAPGCKTTDGRCSKIVKLFIPDKKEYTLASDETGIPTFSSRKRLLPIPAYLPGLRVDKSARFILVSLDSLGVKLKWDGSLLLQIEASESMWNKTAGLCGTMNDNPNDDFLTNSGTYTKSISTLADSWRVNNLGGNTINVISLKDSYLSVNRVCMIGEHLQMPGACIVLTPLAPAFCKRRTISRMIHTTILMIVQRLRDISLCRNMRRTPEYATRVRSK